MGFSNEVLTEAWSRQGGRCAHCGKELVFKSTQQMERGAWHPHHRKAVADGGTDFLGNCVLFCINPPEDCHINIGHAGNYQESPILYDRDLPYLYSGDR